MTPRRRLLGEILLSRQYITANQLDRALTYQNDKGVKLGQALVRLQDLSEDQLAEALASQKGLPVIPLGELYPNPGAVNLLSEKFIRSREVLPIDFEGDSLILGMVDPLDIVTLDDVRVMAGIDVTPVVVTPSDFQDMVEYIFTGKGALDESDLDKVDASAKKLAEERDHAEDVSVVSLVDNILDTALKRRASDIHLEPQLYEMIGRLRIDGVMHPLTQIPNDSKGAVLSRLKIMGDMDIADKRLPQNGRATYRSPEQTVDLRIASIPTVYGENITIRLLDESMYEISLQELGMEEQELDIFHEALARPYGMVLITGPTGSGKSTTLYSALDELNTNEVKIYTVEDPVERKMPGILQSQVKPDIGLTFAAALRSLVRSDPDVIMVGEIRDLQTAIIATESSLTGHMVFSTLHTNDAASTITRLSEMGTPPYLIASSLECVVAQRLARQLCGHCRTKVQLSPAEMTKSELEFFGSREVEIYRAVGCRRCFGTGYLGRVGLFEVLTVTKDLRRLVMDQATADEIREYALSLGMTDLRAGGVRKVLSGATTVEEVERVTA